LAFAQVAGVKRIINFVDELGAINYGIWNAAIATADDLQRDFGIQSQLWFPTSDSNQFFEELKSVKLVELDATDRKKFLQVVSTLDKNTDIIVSHGCWRWPTIWGNWFKQAGFKWIYVPHGMLEPWSMQQKAWKKWPYFWFVEKPFALKSDLVRAVGAPEAKNLEQHFPRVKLIPNGVSTVFEIPAKAESPIIFLFMARLHFKKGPLNLAKAWVKSRLFNQPGFQLLIAGPDEGELQGILTETEKCNNAKYVGPVYGEEKMQLLKSAHFYVLPSLSEGFPTSVVEAMMFGLVPIVSQGINFPEVFEQQLGYDSDTSVESIQAAIELAVDNLDSRSKLQEKGHILVKSSYSLNALARLQAEVFSALMK